MRSKYQIFFVLLSFLLFGRYADAQVKAVITANGIIRSANDTIYVCQGNTIQYTGATSINAATYQWTFTGGSQPSSNQMMPLGVTYSTTNTYTTKLVVQSGLNSRDSVTVFVTVSNSSPPPTAGFEFTQPVQCANIPDTFTSTSSGIGLSYKWNFGDGGTSTQQNPVHQFVNAIGPPGPQTYTVSLTVTDYFGCSSSPVSKPVTIMNMPDATIGNPDPTVQVVFFNGDSTFRRCSNLPFYNFSFTNLSTTIPTNVSDTIRWGDTNTDTVFSPWIANPLSHPFPFGINNLTRFVVANDGCIGVKNYKVFLGSNPASVSLQILGSGSVFCAGTPYQFPVSGTGVLGNAPGTSYTITFSDSTVPPQLFQHPPPNTVPHTFEYSSCGKGNNNDFEARVLIQNPCGLTGPTVLPSLYVSDLPKPSIYFSPSDTVCVNLSVIIVDSSVDNKIVDGSGTCTIGNRFWSIIPSSGWTLQPGLTLGNEFSLPPINGSRQLNVSFNSIGINTVRLKRKGSPDCSDSTDLRVICVNPTPHGSFKLSDSIRCAPFYDTATSNINVAECGRNRVRWTVDSFQQKQGCLPAVPKYSFEFGTTRYSDTPIIYFENAGIYRVKMEVIAPGDSTACIFDTSMIVTVKGKPNIGITADTVLCVNGSTTPSVRNQCDTAGSTSHWIFTGTIPTTSFDGFNPPELTYLNPGMFKIIDTVTNSCGSTIDSVSVMVIAPVRPNAGPDTVMCSGSTISIGLGGVVPGVTYSWTPAAGIANPDTTFTNVTLTYNGGINDTTMYQFILTASVGSDSSCKLSDTVNITVKKSPDLTGNAVTPICIGSTDTSATLIVSGADNYVWSPLSNITLNAAQNTAIVSPPITTTYTVVGSLLNGCTDTLDFFVSVGVKPNLGDRSDTARCAGQQLNLYGLYDSTGLWSSWTLNGNAVSNPSAIIDPGAYQLIGENRITKCLDTLIVNFDTLTKPYLPADRNISICSGQWLNLDTVFTTTGLTTQWLYNNAPVSRTDSVSTPGIYTLIASNRLGCSDTAKINLDTLPKPRLGPDKDTLVCSGKIVNLSSFYNTSGYSPVLWTFGGVSVPNPASVVQEGLYQLKVGNNGCSDTALFRLDTLLTPRLGPDDTVILCTEPGNSVNLNNSFDISNLSASWTLAGVPVADPSLITTSGTYKLVAFNNSGCSDTALVTVTTTAPPNLNPDSTVVFSCKGTPVNLTGYYSPAGFDVSWVVNGSSVPDSTEVYGAGLYILYAQSPGGGCKDTARVIVQVNSKPDIGRDRDTLICPGEKVNLNSFFSLSGYTSLSWTLNGIPVPVPGTAKDSGIYQIIVVDSAGCKDTATAEIIFKPKPEIGNGVITYNGGCYGRPVDITSFYITTGLSVSWTYLGNPVPDPMGVSEPGFYTIVAANTQGCTDTAGVRVNFFAKPVLGNDTLLDSKCISDLINLTTVFPVPVGLVSLWTFNSAGIPPPVEVNTGGFYELVVLDFVSGCSDTAVVGVDFVPRPNLGDNVIDTLCDGYVVNLPGYFTIAPNLNVSWTQNGIPVLRPDSVIATNNSVYRIVGAIGDCRDTAFIGIKTRPSPVLSDNKDSVICYSDSVRLTGVYNTKNWSSQWSFSGISIDTPLIVRNTGLYQLAVTNLFGCGDTALFSLVRKNEIFANAGNDTNTVAGVPHPLYGSGGMTYLWFPGRPLVDNPSIENPTAILSSSTRFLLTVYDTSFGKPCFDTASVYIRVFDGVNIYVPNAFTPDAYPNRDFYPVYVGIKSLDFFRIYNRWGNLIFETNDMQKKWDGVYKGKPQDFGNYVWVVKARDRNNRIIEKKGNVVLLR